MDNQRHMRAWALVFLAVAVLVGVALLPQLNPHGAASGASSAENQFMYEKSIHILVMLLIGFGFLMVFVRKYGYTSITSTYLMVALAIGMGVVVGFLVSRLGRKEAPYDDKEEFEIPEQ
jgi:hypothetical protein